MNIPTEPIQEPIRTRSMIFGPIISTYDIDRLNSGNFRIEFSFENHSEGCPYRPQKLELSDWKLLFHFRVGKVVGGKSSEVSSPRWIFPGSQPYNKGYISNLRWKIIKSSKDVWILLNNVSGSAKCERR